MMTCSLIYYFLRNYVMYSVHFSGSGFFYVGLYCSGEKEETIRYCLIVENLQQKDTALVSVMPYIMGFCLIIIEFVFFLQVISSFWPCYHIFLWVLYLLLCMSVVTFIAISGT